MARFALYNDSDHSAVAWIAKFLTLIYTTLTLLLRRWMNVRMIGIDDLLAGPSQLLAHGSIGSVIFALDNELAKDTPRRSVGNSQEVVKVSHRIFGNLTAADMPIFKAVQAS